VPKAFWLPGLIPAVIADVADALAGVFLPAGCRLCETLLTCATRLPICEKCLDSFGVIGKEICLRCGLPLDAFPAEPGEPAADAASERHCGPCRMGAYHFDRARSVFRYEDLVVRAMVMLKFEEMEPLAEWFGERLARRISGDAAYTGVDLVVPVLLHLVQRHGALTRRNCYQNGSPGP